MITEETRWGILFILWISGASIPYFYLSFLWAIGKRDKSNKILDSYGLPWLMGFAGLAGIWSIRAYAWVGYAYSLLAMLVIVGLVFWRNGQLAKFIRDNEESSGQNLTSQGSSNMLLSKIQRFILIGVTVIIAATLYAQIDEVGLEDSPWMIGLVVIASLLLLAFAPRRT